MVFFFFERIDYVDRPAPILSLCLVGQTLEHQKSLLFVFFFFSSSGSLPASSSALTPPLFRARVLFDARTASKARSVDIFLRRKMIPLEYLGFEKQ